MLMSGWMKYFVLAVVAMLIAEVVIGGSQISSTQLRLPDLTGRQVTPLQINGAKATVFFFVRTDCPISNRYAPEVRRLYEKFAPDGVNFWLVYPNSDESVETINNHLREYKYNLNALRDPQHTLVKMSGVRVTPEAAVFIPVRDGHRIVYRGRIDDRFVAFGRTRPSPTTRDLENILKAIIEGRQVTSKTIPAIGCFISDLQ